MGLKVDSEPTPVSELLAGGALGELRARAERNRSVLEQVREAVDPVYREHIAAARVDGDLLRISTVSGAWSSRLRLSPGLHDLAARLGAARYRFNVLPAGRTP